MLRVGNIKVIKERTAVSRLLVETVGVRWSYLAIVKIATPASFGFTILMRLFFPVVTKTLRRGLISASGGFASNPRFPSEKQDCPRFVPNKNADSPQANQETLLREIMAHRL